MKEAMEIMPETLEYGIINARVLHFLKDVLCQVNGGRGRALGVCETGGGRPLRSSRVQVAGCAPAPGGVPVLVPVPLQSTRSQRQGERVLRRGAGTACDLFCKPGVSGFLASSVLQSAQGGEHGFAAWRDL